MSTAANGQAPPLSLLPGRNSHLPTPERVAGNSQRLTDAESKLLAQEKMAADTLEIARSTAEDVGKIKTGISRILWAVGLLALAAVASWVWRAVQDTATHAIKLIQ